MSSTREMEQYVSEEGCELWYDQEKPIPSPKPKKAKNEKMRWLWLLLLLIPLALGVVFWMNKNKTKTTTPAVSRPVVQAVEQPAPTTYPPMASFPTLPSQMAASQMTPSQMTPSQMAQTQMTPLAPSQIPPTAFPTGNMSTMNTQFNGAYADPESRPTAIPFSFSKSSRPESSKMKLIKKGTLDPEAMNVWLDLKKKYSSYLDIIDEENNNECQLVAEKQNIRNYFSPGKSKEFFSWIETYISH